MKKIIIMLNSIIFITFTLHPVGASDYITFEKKFNQDLMEIYFNRADAESGREEWIRIAEKGLNSAADREIQYIKEEISKRLSAWEWNRMQQHFSFPDFDYLLKDIASLNIAHLYKMIDNNISFDSSGDPEYYGLEQFLEDRKSWYSSAETSIGNIYRDWENRITVKYHELTDENIFDEKVLKEMDVKLSEYKERMKYEMEKILIEEEKNFINKRTRDIYSLKRESIRESADTAASVLVSDAEKFLDQAYAGLTERLLLIDQGTDDRLLFMSLDWEKSFREEFEKGLHKWSDAEKEFVEKSISWEIDAADKYRESELKWDEVYLSFEDARKKWSDKMLALAEEGIRKREERDLQFEDNFKNIIYTMESAALKERNKVEMEISSLISLFRESSNVEIMAKENIDYLKEEIRQINNYKQARQSEIKFYSSEIAKKRKSISMLNLSIASYNNSSDSDDGGSGSIHRIHYYLNIKLARERIDELNSEINILSGKLDKTVVEEKKKDSYLQTYNTELAFWEDAAVKYKELRLKAEADLYEMKEKAYDLSIYSSSYSVELSRLKSRKEMLWKQFLVSESLLAYSIDESSDRDKKSETIENFNLALEKYQAAELEYSSSLLEIESFLEFELAEAEENIALAGMLRKEAEALMEQARSEYESRLGIYKTKNSILIESQIADIELSLYKYFDTDREKVFYDYFTAFEGYERKQTAETAVSIIDDFNGHGNTDYYTDTSVIAEKIEAFEKINIDPDFVTPENLQIYMILNNLNKTEYYDNLTENYTKACEAAGDDRLIFLEITQQYLDMIYAELIYFKTFNNYSVQLLEDDNSYSFNDYLEMMEQHLSAVPENEDILLYQIKKAELDAFISFSGKSPAFISAMAQKRAIELKNILGYAEEADFVNMLSGSPESSDYLNLLIQFYSISNLPVYLETAVKKYLSLKACADRITYDGNAVSLQNEYDIAVDEYDETVEKEWMLSAELDAVRALVEITDKNNHGAKELFREKESLEKIIIMAISVSENPDISYATGEKAELALKYLAAEESKAENNKARLGSLKNELQEWENNQNEYFENNISSYKTVFEDRKRELEKAVLYYIGALENYNDAASVYRTKNEKSRQLYEVYSEAGFNLDIAEEIMDYAISPYRLENNSPEVLFAERKREYEIAEKLYSILKSLDPVKDYTAHKDQVLDELSEELISITGFYNYIGSRIEKLEQQIKLEVETAGRYFNNIHENLGNIFVYQYSFRPDFESSFSDMTDFTDPDMDKTYFNQENFSQVYSTDTFLWAAEMSKYGTTVLRDFGIAFYHEFGKSLNINVPIYSDQYFNSLVTRDSNYKKASVECDPVEHVKNTAGSTYNRIRQNSDLFKLYGFFRSMKINNMISLDDSFIGDDISEIAYDYVYRKARNKESSIRKNHWWSNFWNSTAKKIKAKRTGMAFVDGKEERGLVINNIRSALSFKEKYTGTMEAVSILIGSESDTVTAGSLLKAFDSADNSDLFKSAGMPADFHSMFIQKFENLSISQTVNSVTAAKGLYELFFDVLAETEEKIKARQVFLTMERNVDIQEWLSIPALSDMDLPRIKLLAEKLYADPLYADHDTAVFFLEKIKTIPEYSLRGKEFILEKAGMKISDLFNSVINFEITGRVYELKNTYEKALIEKNGWLSSMEELFYTAEKHWIESSNRLVSEREKWRENYLRFYLNKKELIENRYSVFTENRKTWLEDTAARAVEEQSLKTAREAGINADILILETKKIVIPEMQTGMDSFDSVISRAVSGTLLLNIIEAANILSEKENRSLIQISAFLPSAGRIVSSDSAGYEYGQELSENIRKRVMFLSALNMRKAVFSIEEDLAEKIEQSNKSVGESIQKTFERKGYRKKSNYYIRDAVIDMTFFGGIEKESQKVEEYRYFTSPQYLPAEGLDNASLENDSSRLIELKIEKAMADIRKYSDLIFGKSSFQDARKWIGFDAGFLRNVEIAESSFANSSQYGNNKNTSGLFAYHLGYAPLMDEKNPEKVKTKGYGEYGRLFEHFFRNEGRLGRGLAALEVPWYNQKLWDDDSNNDGKSDSLFGSPSVRSAAGIALTVATGGAMSGVMPFLINMADDVLFTALDVSNNLTDWKQGGLNLAKQAGTGFASSAAGSLIPGSLTSGENFITAGLSSGVQAAVKNLAAVSVNSLEIGNSGLYFSGSSFKTGFNDSVTGAGAVSGYISASGSAALNTSLTGFYGSALHDGKALSSLVSGAAGAAYEYSQSGSTRINILNSRDFGFGNTGILEAGIGKRESLLSFGTGGLDLSTRTAAASIQGLDTYRQNASIALSENENIYDARAGLRVLYSAGKEGDQAAALTYDNLLSGIDRLVFGEGKGSAQTLYEEKTNGRIIRITDPGSGRMSRLEAGILLVHEAHRDGRDSGVLQAGETLNAVRAHAQAASGIAKDYYGFFESNPHIAAEAILFELAEKSGIRELFDYYALSAYQGSGGDFYFPDFADFGMTQNRDAGNRNITLGYDAEMVNRERLFTQYSRYLYDLKISHSELSFDQFELLRTNDESIAKKYNYKVYENTSLAQAGCNLYTLLYMQQTLTGNPISGKDANNILKKNNQYAAGNLLYTDSSKALEILTKGEYSFNFESLSQSKNSNDEIINRLFSAKYSSDIESVRIYDGKHFLLLKDFIIDYDLSGNTEITSLEVINPLANSRTSYSYDEIKRWDFFTASKNNQVYSSDPYQFALSPTTGNYDRRAYLWNN